MKASVGMSCGTVILFFWFVSLIAPISQAAAQSFTCPYGKNAACLDYGDRVCGSFAECVSDDAICFDSFTCNYKGFICKSKYDDVVDDHDRVVRKHNDLVDELGSTERQLAELKNCVQNSYDLDEAQSCAW